ncbi:MAG: methionyl-tRNA formyltransferase [Bacteroidota bacterium]
MGTPDFAVPSLELLVKSGHTISAVITSPDKPAGRGLNLHFSPIKILAQQYSIPILQPPNLKDESFLNQLKKINPDLQVVVAFRMLPELVWSLPKWGTINLHASLLPNYRGAAPINWAIINGETETGATTFFLNNQIDTGDIIDNFTIPILPDETAGELYKTLMLKGADLLLSTVTKIIEGNVKRTQQNIQLNFPAKTAPKIFKNDCRINWNQSVENIYNFIRGLSPYPTAFTEIISHNNTSQFIKIYSSIFEKTNDYLPYGTIITDNETLKITGNDGDITIKELQLNGKKRMFTSEFLKGFKFDHFLKAE